MSTVRGVHLAFVRLRTGMGRTGHTTYTLAEKAGVSRWVISRALNGHRISTASLKKIAAALESSPRIDGGLVEDEDQLPAEAR